jgi:mannose-1-phosphate guanylyltransferase
MYTLLSLYRGIVLASLPLNVTREESFDPPFDHRGRDSQMPGAGTTSHHGKSEPRFLTTSDFDDSTYAALILAGGDGVRLSTLTREVFGYHVPKQFCPLFEGKTLLEQTLDRVSLLVPPSKTLSVLNRAHRQFYTPILSGTPSRNLFIQPENRGTATAVLCALLRLVETGHEGPVAIFPSDHYVSDDSLFMLHVSNALRAVQSSPQLTVLLGIAPDGPETEYGWIEPGSPLALPGACVGKISRIRRFLEKPSPEVARDLYDRNYLWNSFVLIANATTLLSLIAKAVPELYETFSGVRPFFGGAAEAEILQTIYRDLPTTDFSASVLTAFPAEFSVMPVKGVSWSDLGDPKRMVAAISHSGRYILGGNQNVPRSQPFPVTGGHEQINRAKAFQDHR